MSDQSFVDYYKALELAPMASIETIEAVFPVLAARYDPRNPDTGNPQRFKLVKMAHAVLTDPERRPSYDGYYKRMDPAGVGGGTTEAGRDDSEHFEGDRRLRLKLLGLLYDSRRREGPKGIGDYSLEQKMGIGTDDMLFHLWYMTAKGWVCRTDDGQIAITVSGIDQLGQ